VLVNIVKLIDVRIRVPHRQNILTYYCMDDATAYWFISIGLDLNEIIIYLMHIRTIQSCQMLTLSFQ
jgi:hypothetical protein